MSAVIVCDDLIFTSKVTATAKAHGLTMRAVKSASQALALPDRPTAILIDLHTADLEIADFVSRVRCPVIGFGSHVDVERLRNARASGCAKVMPRSQFVSELETKLAEWIQSPIV